MQQESKPLQDISFGESGSMAFKMILVGLILFFGLLSWLAFFMRMSNLDAEDLALLFFAILFSVLAWLLFRFFRNPRVLITKDEVCVRGFWRIKKWRLSQIVGISTKREKLHARRRGGEQVVVPPVVEWIVFEFESGHSDRFIGPDFMNNDKLLSVLSDRLEIRVDRDNRPYEDIPLGESPFKFK